MGEKRGESMSRGNTEARFNMGVVENRKKVKENQEDLGVKGGLQKEQICLKNECF